ncbi:unnamed protein product [Phytomonas sp. EM1]|nr:unnamed protein product [Phytomonas sp. EM1]|eukprot:CCW61249.1 unnamed protein product [Phytomonas sp. isolate EM1]
MLRSSLRCSMLGAHSKALLAPSKEAFVRKLPHLTIGTVGHVDHGKTTLTSAITTTLSKIGQATAMDYFAIDKSPEEKQRKITINATHVEYESKKRHYGHIDCPGHMDFVKNMITGATQMDGGIIVVAATDGVMPQTREHLLICSQIGLPALVGFINKVDAVDEETCDLVELELREQLGKYKFPEEETPIVRGSALKALEGDKEAEAKILELVDKCDEWIPDPPRNVEKPFLMAIEHVYEIGKDKKSVIVTGRVDQGVLKSSADAEIAGLQMKKSTVKVTGIEMYHKTLPECLPGDSVGISIVGTGDTTSLSKDNVERGMVLAAVGSTNLFNKLKAQVYVLTKDEGGRHTGFSPHYRPQIFFHCADITADLSFPEIEEKREELIKKHGKSPEGLKKVEADMKELESKMVCMPGDNREMILTLAYPMPVEKGLKFTIREGKITVGWGAVTDTVALDKKVSIEGKRQVQKSTGKPSKKK